ncbi:hypothetical protein NQ314_011143 [Rhamnusium bicolor]|uniref:Uncharacterized protein n=1 Tax=Rhamnusium bicolor TaxID=1586634 RepID=A0AAV8XLJ1_9CUCU|nr:hypothetical protein NQ314_011143 [Rhamnusium bicolor]
MTFIMRCDERVFRCAPIYAIVLRVLRASLASSRSQLMQHLQSHVRLDQTGQVLNESDRDEMCRACIASQVCEIILFYVFFKGCISYHNLTKYALISLLITRLPPYLFTNSSYQ